MENINNFETQTQPPIIPESPVTPQKNIFKTLFFIILGLFLVSMIIIGTFFITKNKYSTSIVTQEITPTITNTPVVDETQDWKTYTNSEVGINFKYPNSLTITNKLYEGLLTLNISQTESLAGGLKNTGITVNRGGSSLDFNGYTKNSKGQIFYNKGELCDSKLVKKIYTNPNGIEIVILNGLVDPNVGAMIGPCETNGKDVKALINTKSKIYPGFAFVSGPLINESDLLKVLDTVKFEEPTISKNLSLKELVNSWNLYKEVVATEYYPVFIFNIKSENKLDDFTQKLTKGSIKKLVINKNNLANLMGNREYIIYLTPNYENWTNEEFKKQELNNRGNIEPVYAYSDKLIWTEGSLSCGAIIYDGGTKNYDAKKSIDECTKIKSEIFNNAFLY